MVVAKSNLKIAITAKNARIVCEELPTITGTFTHFLQLFQNIISNGIKFHRPGVLPVITVSAQSLENSCIICISDNGIGISPKYQERIFEPFARLHTRDKFEGTGIGLATCRKVVERYNGKIWITSEVGVGTKFFIQLPLVTSSIFNENKTDDVVSDKLKWSSESVFLEN